MHMLARALIASTVAAALVLGGYWFGAQAGIEMASTPIYFAEECAPPI